MKAKSKLLTLLTLTAGSMVGTALINKAIKVSSISKHLLEEDGQTLCFNWRLGNIHYTKEGSGKPLLLIHDLNASSSSYEWKQMTTRLKERYTVYTVDLLGCGQSEKPFMVYTNYLYVQMISDFIKSEIGHRTSVIATGESSSFTIMACCNSPELFDQIMLINPLSLLVNNQIPNKQAKFYRFIIEMPVLGTLLYHFSTSKQAILEQFSKEYFYNPYNIKSNYIDAYYESAHLGQYPKSVYASVKCNYTKCNIVNALKKIDNSIFLVGGKEILDIKEILDEYKDYNSAIEIAFIEKTKLLPQLENPNAIFDLIITYFH